MIAPASRRRVISGPLAVLAHVLPGRQPERRRHALDVELLLDGDRHAGERPERRAARPRGVDRVRFGPRFVEAPGDDGVQALVDRLDPGDMRLEHVARRDGAVGDQASQLARAAPRQVVLGIGSGTRRDADPRVFRGTPGVR